MNLRVVNSGDWKLFARVAPDLGRRGMAIQAAAPTELPPEFLLPGVEIDDVSCAEPIAAVRRGAPTMPLDLQVTCTADERAVIVARHPSGALTFHAPQETVSASRRGARVAPRTLRFRLASSSAGTDRRDVVSQIIKLIVLKIEETAVDTAIQLGGEALEKLWWKKHGLKEGWFKVAQVGGKLQLEPAQPNAAPGERSLLLLHGTFSNTVAAFAGLVTTAGNFFNKAASVYGDRLYAFNHFSVSRTLHENAEALLVGLPARGQVFDVITHSRGGLVLRTLVEQRGELKFGDRFQLGQAVLVATPNQGTPLATPRRWQETIGLVANLMEMFPNNPWTMGADFVAQGIVRLADHITGDMPGLAAMDSAGPVIADLQQPSQIAADAYSALAANFQPQQVIWQRLLDAGIDLFFSSANDLVVPAEGSWLVDPPNLAIAASRVGCFGPGGNVRTTNAGLVHHLNFFQQPETIDFILQTLIGPANPLPPIDLTRPLPRRGLLGSTAFGEARGAASGPPPSGPTSEGPPAEDDQPIGPPTKMIPLGERITSKGIVFDDTLQLTILDAPDHGRRQILAVYGSARVISEFYSGRVQSANPEDNAEARRIGALFKRIETTHKRIRSRLDGDPGAPDLPSEEELIAFGENLFEVLLSGDVRRLFDVARSEQHGRALSVIFMSSSKWLAAMPWEFAFDRSRCKFLATQEIHFTRNVLTAVPAERQRQHERLRLLVVAAQPLGAANLSIDEEIRRIRHGFQPLEQLVEIDVIARATPQDLHRRLRARELEMTVRDGELTTAADRRYDIVHFIAHGGFDEKASEGKLYFQSQEIGTRTLCEILCGRGIQLVFLNACDTARSDDKRRYNRGVAQALVEGGLPAVVANQYPVLDSSAVGFSNHFYWSLANGASLGEAMREARIAVNYADSRESIDWAIPVLFARHPPLRLCVRSGRVWFPPPSAAMVPPKPLPDGRPMTGSAHSRVAAEMPRVIRVGVADLARLFPEMDDALRQLNGVQNRFFFEPVSIVAPLGAWDKHEERGEMHTYLNARRFAKLLQDKPRELDVDYLACVTNRQMRQQDTYGIYAWWSGNKELPVLLFSTAGLTLERTGAVAMRTIANQLAGSLAAQMLESCRANAIHKRGPKDCPFYYNQEVDLQYVTGPLKFDPTCRDKLLKKLPANLAPTQTLQALDRLLTAFSPQ